MSQNMKKKSRIEMEKEKFIVERDRINTNELKIKNFEIKSQVFKFDMVILKNFYLMIFL